MKTRIVRIGNSQGVRIPKPLLDQAGLSGDVELVPADQGLLIRPVSMARAGWSEAFQKLSQRGEIQPCDAPPSLSTWDDTEWTW